MAKVTKVPPFVQITSASWVGDYAKVDGVVMPVVGTILYGLDKKGRVWRKMGSGYVQHWHLLTDAVGPHPEERED